VDDAFINWVTLQCEVKSLCWCGRREWWYYCSTHLQTLWLSTGVVRVLCMSDCYTRDLLVSDCCSILEWGLHKTNWWHSSSTRRRVIRRDAHCWTKWLPPDDIPSHYVITVALFCVNIWQRSQDSHWHVALDYYRCLNSYDAICYWTGSNNQVIYSNEDKTTVLNSLQIHK